MSTSSSRHKQGLSALTLLFSLGTLLCCALPLLLVALGLGSAVAVMTSSAPWLVTLSQYKEWTFAGSALVLALAGWALYRPARSCPTDPVLASACARADRWSRRVWLGSVLIWAGAGFVAFLWLPLRLALS
ncbi:hypothetical protein [Lysobacter sp. D1-1-M9]|uniref:hypothetical protein n=1 Tax=Novilysobacter longmucuonensis TaxID=3098603 RepID=UPI002FC82EE6